MDKQFWNRILLGIIQHLTAVTVFLTIALLLSTIYIDLGSFYGQERTINPTEKAERFSDSELFSSMMQRGFENAVRLVVIRQQMETDGEFDGVKIIDVSEYATRRDPEAQYNVTAQYFLEDLIRWGRYGVEYTSMSLTKEELIGYFGKDVLNPSYFYLDENGDLQFWGFYPEEVLREVVVSHPDRYSPYADIEILNENSAVSYVLDSDVTEEYYKIFFEYQESGELTELVYDYIVEHSGMEFTPVLGENGRVELSFGMLKCRYDTVDGIGRLTNIVDNWVDYGSLEYNLVMAIDNLKVNYEEYAQLNPIYDDANSNFKYLVRYWENQEWTDYTNCREFAGMKEQELDAAFKALGSYTVYSPDSMICQGNVELSEQDIYQQIQKYDYAIPEYVKIWIGTDTAYPVQDDAFARANRAFERIVPHFTQIIIFLGALLLVWLCIWLYLTVTAGREVNAEGNVEFHLNGFDRAWTEIILAFAAGVVLIGYYGAQGLALAIRSDYFLGDTSAGAFFSGGDMFLWGAYGFMASMTFSIFWYSLVRRIRGNNLWKNSFLHWLFCNIAKGCGAVTGHPSAAIRTFIPYSVFLGINGLGALTVFLTRGSGLLLTFVLGAVAFVDLLAGIMLFRKNAEQVEIVKGINRIREGDVDYQLDCGKLHGDSRKLAEAVNNIGDGIRKAVETSMKDERMKADLITNVSHDIKTPLTSIINYVDLLKREKIQQEPVKSYIQVLDGKTQRLKQLTDDLVEASKISSGNIIMDKEKLDLTELLNQTVGEFSERLEQNGLQAVFTDCGRPAWIYADSRRMWRIVENLFNNICKYALPGTRVYIDLTTEQGVIEASIKNISSIQLNNISPDELTERFVRGDASRTTEGSGLGLSIAKSLTRAQGGEFTLYLDGDLFKVILRFPEYTERRQEPDEEDLYAVQVEPARKSRALRRVWEWIRFYGLQNSRKDKRRLRMRGNNPETAGEPADETTWETGDDTTDEAADDLTCEAAAEMTWKMADEETDDMACEAADETADEDADVTAAEAMEDEFPEGEADKGEQPGGRPAAFGHEA